MGRLLRLLEVLALTAYVVGRLTPNFNGLLRTITSNTSGGVSHRREVRTKQAVECRALFEPRYIQRLRHGRRCA